MLLKLMGWCFQHIGLTKWTNIIAKQFPTDADHMKANFNKCIRDYLEAVAGFPNVSNQLIHWLHTAKKSALMPMHKFMRGRVQLIRYLHNGYPCRTMEILKMQEKSKQISFTEPKSHQFQVRGYEQDSAHGPAQAHCFL